jgi:hypothetical protein
MPRWALWVHVLLFVPYLTGAISYGYGHGWFPIRPVIYLLSMGFACLYACRGRGAMFPKTTLLIMAVLVCRMVDVGVLQRFETPEGNVEMAVSIGSSLFIVLVGAISISVWAQRDSKAIFVASFLTMVIGIVVNLLEFMGYGAFSSVPGRAAGFLVDANDSSIAIVNSLAVCLTLSKSFWKKALMLGAAATGIVPTFSRSGMLVYALICVVFVFLHFRQYTRQIVTMAVSGITLGVVGLGAFRLTVTDGNAKARMEAIFGGDTKKLGSSERLKDVEDGIAGAMQRPILGHGVGAGSSKWQPHNEFVSLWVEHGIVGAVGIVGIWVFMFFKCLLQKGTGVLMILPHIAFVPFTQMQMETISVFYSALLVAHLTSRSPIRFALLSPTPRVTPMPSLQCR